jgi:ATP-binding cassette subfamily C protein CydCD
VRAPRGPLGALRGLPGVAAAVVHAALAALVQTAGLVLLAGGLAHAVARVAGLADGGVATPLALAAAGAGLRALATTAGEAAAARDGRRVEEALRARLVERLAASPAAVAAAGGPASAAVLATTRLHGLGPALATLVPALVQTAVVPPVLLLVLATTDLLSAVLVAVTLPLVPVFMVLVGKHTQDGTRAAARALDRVATSVAELVRGLPVLTGLGRAAEQTAALADLGEATRTRTLSVLRLAFLSALVLELLATLSVALVAVTVGLRLIEGQLSLAVGLTALLLAPEAFAPLRALGAAHHAGEDATLAAAEARAVLGAPTPDVRRTDGSGVAVLGATVRYPGRAVPALPPTSLTVRPGDFVALRGASGSGKSTLLGLLAGVLPPDADVAGAVSAAADVAAVPQHPRTTRPTVAAEVARHAAGDLQPALDALADVGAAELADRTCTTLSPGELSRVALARALVRVRLGARLLLLDEPTAHLDADATARVAAVLTGLRGTVTTVLVSHDPALTALADRTIDLGPPPSGVSATATVSPSAAGDGSTPAPAAAVGSPVAGIAVTSGTGIGWPGRALARAVATGAASSLAGVALTAVSGWLIVRAAEMPPVLTLLVAIVGVRAFGLARACLRWAERMTAHDAALRLAAATRVRVWEALAAQGLAADRTPGSALARVVGDVGVLQDLSVRVRPPALVAGTVMVGTVGALAVLDPGAALAVAGALGLTVAAVVAVLRRLDAGAARAESGLRVDELREVTTVLQGADDLRAHGLADRVAADLRALSGRRAAAGDADTRATAVASGLAVAGTGLAAVLATAVAATGDLAGPAVAALALAPLALAEPLGGLVQALRLRGALADARGRLAAVLDAPVPADPAEPLPAPAPVHDLAVDGLTAGWPGGPDVLRSVTATATAGAGWLVVRGRSGAGKSTLLAVLMAALRPRAGRYDLDGLRADRMAGDDVRSRMAWLPQDAHVFASTLRANLALAAPRGELAGPAGEARMRAALTAAGLGGLLAGLPRGLDTPVGAGGTGLSGGERRRLAAARALLADRDVVLLDEPTAHLDPPTAGALVRDLRRALAGRLVVCVTHDDDLPAAGDTVVRLGEAAVPLPA